MGGHPDGRGAGVDAALGVVTAQDPLDHHRHRGQGGEVGEVLEGPGRGGQDADRPAEATVAVGLLRGMVGERDPLGELEVVDHVAQPAAEQRQVDCHHQRSVAGLGRP